MRFSPRLRVSLLAAVLALAGPFVAAAEDNPSWQAGVGVLTAPDQRISACSSVIDAKVETGRKLAAAYCNLGQALTEKALSEKGDLGRALADLDEAVRIDPAYARAHANRGRVYALQGDPRPRHGRL